MPDRAYEEAMGRTLATILTAGLLLVGSLAFATGAAASTPRPAPRPASARRRTAPRGAAVKGGTARPGLGLISRISVVNTISANGGSAKVTIRECHGAAGDPTA